MICWHLREANNFTEYSVKNTNYTCWHISPFFRRRAYACTFFDHEYKGTSNKVMKAWNDSLIYFVPMLASLTEDTLTLFGKSLLLSKMENFCFRDYLLR